MRARIYLALLPIWHRLSHYWFRFRYVSVRFIYVMSYHLYWWAFYWMARNEVLTKVQMETKIVSLEYRDEVPQTRYDRPGNDRYSR